MKRKLLFAIAALLCSVGSWADVVPTASTPETGNTYYLYNPKTNSFLFSDQTPSGTPYVKSLGQPWVVEESDKGGYVKLRLKGHATGYFWGKYWASVGSNYNDYPSETYFRLDKIGDTENYHIYANAWDGTADAFVYINAENNNRVACNSQEQGSLDADYTVWQFITEANYEAYSREANIAYSFSELASANYAEQGVAPAGGKTYVLYNETKRFLYNDGNTPKVSSKKATYYTLEATGYDFYIQSDAGYLYKAYAKSNSDKWTTTTNGPMGNQAKWWATDLGDNKYKLRNNQRKNDGDCFAPNSNGEDVTCYCDKTSLTGWYFIDVTDKDLAISLLDALEQAKATYYTSATEDAGKDALISALNAVYVNYVLVSGFTSDTYDAGEAAIQAAIVAKKAAELADLQGTIDDSYLNNATYVNIVGAERTGLSAAKSITAAEETLAAYETAISEVQDAIDTFTGAKTSYDALAEARITGATYTTVQWPRASTTKKTALDNAITAEAPTSAADAVNKTNAIVTAYRQFVESNGLAEGIDVAVNKGSYIAGADPNTNTGWTDGIGVDDRAVEKYTDGDGNTSGKYYDGGWSNSAVADITMTRTLTLPAGQYQLQVTARGSSKLKEYYMSIGGEKVDLPKEDGDAATGTFGHGWSDRFVVFNSDGSELTLTIRAYSEGTDYQQWISFNRFRLMKLDATLATAEDYENLNNAINTVEAKLGFDEGDYAPYNNIASMDLLAAAKAIDQNANNAQEDVQEATSNLNGAVWTANDGEVNAIAYGDLSSYETVGGKDYPWGWSKLNDGSRIMGGSEGTDNTGLSASSTGKAMLVKYNANYGRNEDYLMPLKANTYYTLSFKYCGWGNTPDTRVVIKDSESQALTFTPSSFTPATNNGYSNAANWYEYKATFKTNDAGNYSIELNKVQSGQQQIAWADMNLVRATVSEIKPLLNSEIVAANATYNSGANVGEGVFQIPASAGMVFNTAINTTAQEVYDNPSATVDEVVTAIENLKAAEEAYANAELNAPSSSTHYYLKVLTSGHAKEGNAVVASLGSTSDNNPSGYSFNVSAAPAVYLAQAVTFTSAEDGEHPNRYYITFEGPQGALYLTNGTNNGSKAGWKAAQIQGNTDSAKKMGFDITPSSMANGFHIYNTETETAVACEDGGALYTNGIETDFTLAEATQASVSVHLSSGKYGTRIFPFTPSTIDGITYYSCETVNGSDLKMDEVAEPAANTPYILYASKDVNETLEGWGTASTTSYESGLLTGIYNNTTIAADAHNYVLQTLNGIQAFYLVKENFTNTQPYRAYITYEASPEVKALNFVFDELPTAINAVEAAENEKAEIYNLAGQRLNKAQKGVNIINGKKVLVK